MLASPLALQGRESGFPDIEKAADRSAALLLCEFGRRDLPNAFPNQTMYQSAVWRWLSASIFNIESTSLVPMRLMEWLEGAMPLSAV
jgi:hypothetical protein